MEIDGKYYTNCDKLETAIIRNCFRFWNGEELFNVVLRRRE